MYYYLYFSNLLDHKITLCFQFKKKTVNQFSFVGESFSKIYQQTRPHETCLKNGGLI